MSAHGRQSGAIRGSGPARGGAGPIQIPKNNPMQSISRDRPQRSGWAGMEFPWNNPMQRSRPRIGRGGRAAAPAIAEEQPHAKGPAWAGGGASAIFAKQPHAKAMNISAAKPHEKSEEYPHALRMS